MKLLKATGRWKPSARAQGKSSTTPDANSSLASLVALAWWRLRQSWGWLIVVGLGMVLSTILVCAVPLYTLVAMSAGVRQTLAANPSQQYITVNGHTTLPVASALLNDFIAPISNDLITQVGSGIVQRPQVSLQTNFLLSGNNLPDSQQYDYNLKCMSYDPQTVAPHIKLLQGRLLKTGGNTVEVLLTPEEAAMLHARVGSVFTAPLSYQYINIPPVSLRPLPQTLAFQVVGIFQVPAPDDAFWQGQNFTTSASLGQKETLTLPVIVANTGILNAFDTINALALSDGEVLSTNTNVTWYYHIDISKLNISNVSSVADGLAQVQADIHNGNLYPSNGGGNTTVVGVQVFVPSSLLTTYLERISAAIVPVVLLTLLLLGLALFFVNQMCGLLIERQAETIALLRSRGASQRQIFGMFALQGILLGAVALVVGPLFALALVHGMVAVFLRGGDQGALSLIGGNPFVVAWSVRWYALATVLAALGAMVLVLVQTARVDVQQLRREAARARKRSLLQRLHWDVVMLVLAAAIYGVTIYMLGTGLLDAQLTTLWLSPLSTLAAVCIVLAGAFLLVRLLPHLLNLLARRVTHARGATFLLAVVQIARAPRQTLRTMLLLLLTTAFAIFTLLFFATQGQRISSVAAYQAGADFSGTIVTPPLEVPGTTPAELLAQVRNEYQHIPGILSISPGYVTTDAVQGTTTTIEVHAVDTETFAQSTLWEGSDVDTAAVASLMAQFQALRPQTLSRNVLPVIVDAATWNALHLRIGAHFVLTESNGSLPCVVLAEMPHIPTISDSTNDANSGGMLVDYISYATFSTHTFGKAFPVPSTVWLHTQQSPASLSTVRNALTRAPFQLEPLYDRQSLTQTLSADPLYLTLLGILAVGAIVTLLLALLGSLLTSWFSTGTRLTNFAVLRALGSTPRQVTQVMAWEQGSIYLFAIGWGIVAGIIFSLLAVPLLVFTGTAATGVGSTTSGNSFFLLQSAPPIQVVFPPSLIVASLLLCAFCALALALVVRFILRTSFNTVLRLNAD